MDSAEYVRRITDANLRIRELEAELAVRMAENRSMWEALGKPLAIEPDLQTRVERAEARAEKAEVRVAELTEHLGVGHECTHRFHVEAREREAE